jgi:hypothetical protein
MTASGGILAGLGYRRAQNGGGVRVRLLLLLLAASLALTAMGTSRLVWAADNSCPCTLTGATDCGVGCVSCATESRSCKCEVVCGGGSCTGDLIAYCDVANSFYEVSRTSSIATCAKLFDVQLTTCDVTAGCQAGYYKVVSEWVVCILFWSISISRAI